LKADIYGRYYICGYTLSQDLPVTSDALYSSSSGASNDGFIAVFNPSALPGSGNVLVYATYITGPGAQAVYGVDVVNPPPASTTASAVARTLIGREASAANPIVQIFSIGTTTSNIFPGATPVNVNIGKPSAFILGLELQAPAAVVTGAHDSIPRHQTHP
jgi:hypothetical protein